jgi:hypothetical protein
VQLVPLTRTHRILVAVVVAGAVVIAAIGFAGSYAAVRNLAVHKGFGAFAPFFPIGVDAGIVVLLALDLLLTWIRIPFPLLRQAAWLLTAATIAFNGAAAWPDPLGVGMHAVIPVLFVVSVEAARHAIGRMADITADKHMEGVRVSRWLLAFPSTFRLWRRMKLWELRSYDEVIRMEQDRLIYEARLRARYGRNWRRRAPVESLMPLKLARYGVPLAQTGPAGLAAAGISAPAAAAGQAPEPVRERPPTLAATAQAPAAAGAPADEAEPAPGREQQPHEPAPRQQPDPRADPRFEYQPEPGLQPQAEPHPGYAYAADARGASAQVTVPVGPGRRRNLGSANAPATGSSAYLPSQRADEQQPFAEQPGAAPAEAMDPATQSNAPGPGHPAQAQAHAQAAQAQAQPQTQLQTQPQARPQTGDGREIADPVGIPDGMAREEFYFTAYREYVAAHVSFPTARQLSRALHEAHGVTDADGSLLSEGYLRPYMREFRERYNTEMGLAG